MSLLFSCVYYTLCEGVCQEGNEKKECDEKGLCDDDECKRDAHALDDVLDVFHVLIILYYRPYVKGNLSVFFFFYVCKYM